MAFDWLETKLTQRAEQGLLRQRYCQQYEKDNIICINDNHYLNFSSNDYLGMRQNEGMLQAWVEGLAQFGGSSGASPLVTGHTQAHLALEAYIAEGLNREAALLFNSGFAANQALCMALFSRHAGATNLTSESVNPNTKSAIFADKLMHASFLEGAMCVGEQAQLRRFRHNDTEHLESLLEKRSASVSNVSNADTLIVSEGVFSMDGDVAPSVEIAALAHKHKAWFMLDDAHGMGVLGESGFGTVEALGLSQAQAPIVMGTFGKAIGTAGAFIAGSQTLIDFLVNFAKHYIYSTAMPPAQAVATLYSLSHIANDKTQRDKLAENIAYFRQTFNQVFGIANGVSAEGKALADASVQSSNTLTLADSQSAIQPIIVGCPNRAVALSEGLKQRGIWVSAIRYPTVPKNQDRLRVTLSANHTAQDIDVLVDAIMLAHEELV